MGNLVSKCFFYLFVGCCFSLALQAKENQPCKSFEKAALDLQEFCRSEVKKYANEKFDLGLMGLARLRNSREEKDIPIRRDLGQFASECKKNEAKKLLAKNQIDENCLTAILSKKNPFEKND